MSKLKNLLIGIVAMAPLAAMAEPAANYNGRTLLYSGNDRPFSIRGNTMLAARATCNQIGARLSRDNSGRYLELTWNQRLVRYVKGDTKYTINGTQRGLSVSSEDRNDVLFLPIAMFKDLTRNAVMEGFGNGSNNGNNSWGNNNWGNNGGDRDQDRDAYYRGRRLSFSGDETPYRFGNTTMLPIRSTSSQIGASFERSSDGRMMWIRMGRDSIELEKGRNSFRFNGDRRSLNPSTQERNRVLFAPLALFKAIAGNDISDRPGGSGWGGNNGNNGGNWGGNGGWGGIRPIYYRGNEVRFSGNERTFKEHGTTQVPLRSMASQTGLTVERDDRGDRVWINGVGQRVEYEKGRNYYRINGRRESMGGARSVEKDSILFVPIEIFRAILGGDLTGG